MTTEKDDQPVASRGPTDPGEKMPRQSGIIEELKLKLGQVPFVSQVTRDEFPTLWIPKEKIVEVLQFLKSQVRETLSDVV